MLERLNAGERLLLLQFVCSFAWADGEVSEPERKFVRRIVERLELPPHDVHEVESWLLAPPDAPDPQAIPAHHRQSFIDAVRALIFVDGRVDPAEEAHLDRLRATLG